MNKDLTVATGVFAACVLILVIAFSKPPEDELNFDSSDKKVATVSVPTPDTNDDPPGFDDPMVGFDAPTPPAFQPNTNVNTSSNANTSSSQTINDIDQHLNEMNDEPSIAFNDDVLELPTSGRDATGPDVEVANTNTPINFDVPVNTTSSPSPTGAGADRIHMVERGDILGTISQKYYGTTRYWRLIQDKNNVYANELQPGQRLIIPAVPDLVTNSVASNSTATSTPNPNLSNGQRSYTVKRGDNYYIIAQRELGDASRYKELESLNKVDAYELNVGAVIVLPESNRINAAAQPEARPIAGAKTHVIAAGETLGDISKQHYGTVTRWREIAAANGIVDPGRLSVGKTLQIPNAGAAAASTSSATSSGTTSRPAATNAAATYVIVAGDTLGEISQKTLGTATRWREIQAANPGINPTRLTVGDKIVIPGGRVSAPAGSSRSGTDTDIDFR